MEESESSTGGRQSGSGGGFWRLAQPECTVLSIRIGRGASWARPLLPSSTGR